MLDHGQIKDIFKRLARESGRSHTGRNDNNSLFLRHTFYWGKTPQSTLMDWPVMAEDASEAKNRHTCATSCAVGNLPKADCPFTKFIRYCWIFFPWVGDFLSAKASNKLLVSIYTGQTAFTRIPNGPYSLANAWVKPFTPNLETQYTELLALPRFPARLETLIMQPFFDKCFPATLHTQNVPLRFVSIISSQNRSATFATGSHWENPAQLT